MKRLHFLFGFNKDKKKDVKTIDEFEKDLLNNDSSSILENNEVIVGGILEGRSPEFIDLTPNHIHRNINNEFDMLP